MSRKRKIIKWSLIVLVSLIVSLVGFGYWFMSLLDPVDSALANIESTVPADLSYVVEDQPVSRGKILAVVTSCSVMGNSQKSTGYELTELARAYYVFVANGFEVDIASPKGGKPPVVIDDEDMGAFDYAFLNDSVAQAKVHQTIAIQDVRSGDYEAVYFVGGKGAMFDFPDNEYIQSLVRAYYEEGKAIGAVCHGPAALVNVTLSDGSHLLEGKAVSAFTNLEELFLIKDAPSIFPFLLQDKLTESGAIFNEGHMYLEKVSQDGNLVTGQNPWSTWATAEAVVRQLGYQPKVRARSAEEYAVDVLSNYESEGYDQARMLIAELYSIDKKHVNKELLAVHSILAAMNWDIGKSIDLIRLLAYIKSIS